MDLILFHHAEYDSLYNCSFYNVEDVPLERRQYIVLGWIFIVLFVVLEVLYIPCIFAIGKSLQHASFKFMFYIGILDIVVLCVAGLLTGYFAITGAVFCSHPTLIYVSGIFGLGLWIAESTASMVLALNRCFEVCSPRIAIIIYGGKAAWLWLIPVSLYAFCTVYFGKIITFSGIYMAWFFNPHVGYDDDFGTTYHNYVASAHNLVVCVGLTVLYLGFCISLLYKRCYYDQSSNTVQHDSKHSPHYDKMPFVQVFLITIVNMISSAIYVLMQFVPISEALIILGQFTWLLAHGMPPLIYLTLNRTIRKEARLWWLKVLCCKKHTSAVSVQSSHSMARTESSLKYKRTEHGVIIQNNS